MSDSGKEEVSKATAAIREIKPQVMTNTEEVGSVP